MTLLMLLMAQAQAGSLAADRLAVYHHAVETLSEDARLGILTAWQGSFTVKVVGLAPAVGEASQNALAARGFSASLGSGSAPYLDGALKAGLYTVTTRAGLPAPNTPAFGDALLGFAARDVYLEPTVDGTTAELRGVASGPEAAARLELLLGASPCFGSVEALPTAAVDAPAVPVAFAVDTTPALAAGLTDCLDLSALPAPEQVQAWMDDGGSRGLTLQRATPRGSGRSQLGVLDASGDPSALLAWLQTVEAPDQETQWRWDPEAGRLRVRLELFSAAPLDAKAQLAVDDALRAHRRAQRRAPKGTPDLQAVYQAGETAVLMAELAEDAALLRDSQTLLAEGGFSVPQPPPLSDTTQDGAQAALGAQAAAFADAVQAHGLTKTTQSLDLSLRVISMFVDDHGGRVLPGQVVQDRREGLVRHLHVEVQIQGAPPDLEALHEVVAAHVQRSAPVLQLAETAVRVEKTEDVQGDTEIGILPLTFDLWGVDPLPDRTPAEPSPPPVTRAEMLDARGRPAASARDPFTDPPAFDAARAAAQAVPTCARQPLGAYTYVGHDAERGQFELDGERCEVAVGARLGTPLDGMDAGFVLVGADADAARFELRATNGGPAAIQATTVLERSR